MCELFCLASRRPTVATVSLKSFAARGGLDGKAVDGWGLAFHDGRDVRLYREPEPAADSGWLRCIEQRPIASRLLVSHIRHATRGAVCLANTQPFVRELGGRAHVFAHNGRLEIGAVHRGAGPRFQSIGETDSEVAFCELLDRLAALWRGDKLPELAERRAVVARFAAEMRALGPANFLYADGDAVFAHGHRRTQSSGAIRPPGLWRLERRCPVDRDALPGAGVTITSPEPQTLTLVASVPLTDEAWVPLAEGEVVTIKDGRVVATE